MYQDFSNILLLPVWTHRFPVANAADSGFGDLELLRYQAGLIMLINQSLSNWLS